MLHYSDHYIIRHRTGHLKMFFKMHVPDGISKQSPFEIPVKKSFLGNVENWRPGTSVK